MNRMPNVSKRRIEFCESRGVVFKFLVAECIQLADKFQTGVEVLLVCA